MNKELHKKLDSLDRGDNLMIPQCPYCGEEHVMTVVEDIQLIAYEDEDGYDNIIYISSFEQHKCKYNIVISEYYYRTFDDIGFEKIGLDEIQTFDIYKGVSEWEGLKVFISKLKEYIDNNYIVSDGNISNDITKMESLYKALLDLYNNGLENSIMSDKNSSNTSMTTINSKNKFIENIDYVTSLFNNQAELYGNVSKLVKPLRGITSILLKILFPN